MENKTYISLGHQEGNKNQMFRSNQPTFMILPNISMIMYELFWSKYFFYLYKKGFNFSDDLALSITLYSTEECNLNYIEIPGIIAQCAIIINQGGEVDTFDRFLSNGPSGWLFQGTGWVQPYLDIVNKLGNKRYGEASTILKGLMGNNFKNLLKEEYIEFDDFLKCISNEAENENDAILLLSTEIGKRIKEKYHN